MEISNDVLHISIVPVHIELLAFKIWSYMIDLKNYLFYFTLN